MFLVPSALRVKLFPLYLNEEVADSLWTVGFVSRSVLCDIRFSFCVTNRDFVCLVCFVEHRDFLFEQQIFGHAV